VKRWNPIGKNFPAFERLFHERGLPQAIRSDNGVPFASPHGLFQLSKLSVWWLRLGISIERIRPGHPQQNDRTVVVTSCGRLCLYNKKINLSTSLAGQAVGGQGGGRRRLASQFYELRSRLY
jgi:hypothetical protein